MLRGRKRHHRWRSSGCDHINQIRGDIGAVLREDHACVSIIALLAEQAQAIIEAVDVPRILQRERDLGLGKDGIEVLGSSSVILDLL